jgi:hypothetical protein
VRQAEEDGGLQGVNDVAKWTYGRGCMAGQSLCFWCIAVYDDLDIAVLVG